MVLFVLIQGEPGKRVEALNKKDLFIKVVFVTGL
jgi:hypothetical protein